MGIIALVGGNEFRPECEPMDLALLQRIDSKPPKVAILPTAAAHDGPEIAAENGVRYFTALEARPYAVMVIDEAGANDAGHVSKVQDADMVYLAGGNPRLLLEILRGSGVMTAITRLYEQGGVIAGSSAGAMVMAEQMRENRAVHWIPALGVVKGVAVLPHYNHTMQSNYKPLRAALDPHIAMLGIAEATACVWDGGKTWQVVGIGEVTVYSAGDVQRCNTGEYFTLSQRR